MWRGPGELTLRRMTRSGEQPFLPKGPKELFVFGRFMWGSERRIHGPYSRRR
jgi:hypothetical protein